MTAYTDAEIDAVAEWLGEGRAASQIADLFSAQFDRLVTRNAMIGLIARNKRLAAIGLAPRKFGRAPKPKAAAAPRKPMAVIRNATVAFKGFRFGSGPAVARSDVKLPPAPPLPTNPPVGFLDAVTRNLCLYFAGSMHSDAGPDMLVCGAPRDPLALPNNRYCACHNRRKVAA